MNYFEFMRPCYVKVRENLFCLFWFVSLYILQTYFIMQLDLIMTKRRVGIVGYGSLGNENILIVDQNWFHFINFSGQYLAEKVRTSADFELVFVWNRSTDKITDIEDDLKLNKLEDIPHRFSTFVSIAFFKQRNKICFFALRKVDIIVEVAHPDITKQYAEIFIQNADYLVIFFQ